VTADPGELSARPRISSGDIDRLFRAKSALLFAIAFRILGSREDAEDTLQNAWIKAMLPWPGADRSLETPQEQCAFMVRVVVNQALQRIRERERSRESLGADPIQDPRILEPVEEYLQVRERYQAACRAIARLPEGSREVIALYAAGYEYREIAEMLDVSVSTVRSHMSNARRHLRRVLPGAGEGKPE
jgi:RNA polymerase sigma-70 factor (ECF subfamily)